MLMLNDVKIMIAMILIVLIIIALNDNSNNSNNNNMNNNHHHNNGNDNTNNNNSRVENNVAINNFSSNTQILAAITVRTASKTGKDPTDHIDNHNRHFADLKALE